jgi:hypothetical protein
MFSRVSEEMCSSVGMTKHMLCTLVLVGCHSHSGGMTGDDQQQPDAAPAAFAESPHGPPPQLVNVGGTVLTAPKIQPIFFAGDATMQASIEDFSHQLATSTYWTTTTSEYGVGALTVLPTIVTSDAPPTTNAALSTFITSHLDGTHTAQGWPATVDPQTIYSLFTADGVVIQDPQGNSCDAYGAFHDEETSVHGEPIVYAFMPRCDYGIPKLDELTESFSHELVEAATDPYVNTHAAFGDADADNYVMAYTPAAEAGDYCEYIDAAYQKLVGNFIVQRTWSNAASLAGTDPCVPAPATPYVAAVPMFTESLPIDSISGTKVMTRGAQVPMNMTKTVDIQLISDVPTDAFTIKVTDLAAMYGGPTELTFTLDNSTGKNGDVLHMDIKRVHAGQIPGSEFMIEAQVGGTTVSEWWGYVAN